MKKLLAGLALLGLGAGIAASTMSSSSAVPDEGHYVVVSGDTWLGIADKLAGGQCPSTQRNALADQLARANGQASRSSTTVLRPDYIVHYLTSNIPDCTPPATTTTTAPATTTTVAATTTTAAATTTTAAATTTTVPATTVAPTTTLAAGTAFTENFADPTAFATRFDHGFSGEILPGLANGNSVNDWQGDHALNADGSCTDAMSTHTIHITLTDTEQQFYQCAPGGDPAKAHVMTSVNTEGYDIAWFSPKGYFSNVHKVCWDQNLTDLGGGKWTMVVFATQADAEKYNGDLGFVGPIFQAAGGPTTGIFPSIDTTGVKMFRGGIEAWRGNPNNTTFPNDGVTGSIPGTVTSDKMARYTHCVTDNENGTLTLSAAQPGGGTSTGTVPGFIPNGLIRVIFEDDSYNPDKHFDAAGVPPNSSNLYTWHWDNISIATG